jgi:hypothetical protein
MEPKSKNHLLKKGNKSIQQSIHGPNTMGSTSKNAGTSGKIGFDVESNHT